MTQHWKAALGAVIGDDGRCQFRVWAPFIDQIEIHLIGSNDRYVPLEADGQGYHHIVLSDIEPGQRYQFRLNGGEEYPDLASRYQPQGVFTASQVIDPSFAWTDDSWRGLPLREYIIYELHIGTFSPEGTFTGAIAYLDELVDLGVTAIEVMPVNQFPGSRGWGYDGVFLFAVQNSYGTPQDFKAFVNACHERGLAVILDVVYNHFGPEGNHVSRYGPYTTDHYRAPWGEAVNVDSAYSDDVRAFFIENTLYWIADFHVDALRLDAIHTIFDNSARTFIDELVDEVHNYAEQSGRHIYLIAESDLNDPALLRPRSVGGSSMDATWLDDFHHSLHTLLTYETNAYYQDYGKFQQLVKSLRSGFVYEGQYAPARKHRHGAPSDDVPVEQFVIFVQNHDQIGNRMPNERAIDIFAFDALKLSFGLVLLSPYIPMLFMGDEYGETAEFEYFIDYTDPNLIEAVRKGRKDTFGSRMKGDVNPPDPQAEDTFTRSKLNRQLRDQPRGRVMLDLHRELIRLRKHIPALRELERHQMDVHDDEEKRVIGLYRWAENSAIYAAFNLSETQSDVVMPVPEGVWRTLMESSAPRWNPDQLDSGVHPEPLPQTSEGNLKLTLPPLSFILLERA